MFLNLLSEELVQQLKSEEYIYILVTDTKTSFSKISSFLTRHPYNHISISFDKDLKKIYTFSIKSPNGLLKGGFTEESLSSFSDNARYSLYSVKVSKDTIKIIKSEIKFFKDNINDTKYNHLALINSLLNKKLFDNSDNLNMICSEFVDYLFKKAGIELLKNRESSTIKPYEIVQSKLVKFVKKGLIKNHKLN